MEWLNKDVFGRLNVLQADIDRIMHDKAVSENCRKLGYVCVENPAAAFTRDARAGRFDGISDEAYQVLQVNAEGTALFWRDRQDIRIDYRDLYLRLIPLLAEALSVLDRMLEMDRIPKELQYDCEAWTRRFTDIKDSGEGAYE